MGKFLRPVAFFVCLTIGYVLSNTLFVLAQDHQLPAITNFTQDRRLLFLALVFTGVVYPLLLQRDNWIWRSTVSGVVCGGLGAFHYLAFSLNELGDLAVRLAILAQGIIWSVAGLLAPFAAWSNPLKPPAAPATRSTSPKVHRL